MDNNSSKLKGTNHYTLAFIAVVLAAGIAFMGLFTHGNSPTGFVTASDAEVIVLEPELIQFSTVQELGTLAEGNYYIDSYGFVYWMDDSSTPQVGKVSLLHDSQRSRLIYIDDHGNVGYVIG
jgi:hypothetical protein